MTGNLKELEAKFIQKHDAMRRSGHFDVSTQHLMVEDSPRRGSPVNRGTKVNFHAVHLLKQLNRINHDHGGREKERRLLAQSLDGLASFKKDFHEKRVEAMPQNK
jgi:hypothetical protein